MSDPTFTMYFHNMYCDLSNKILFKPIVSIPEPSNVYIAFSMKLPYDMVYQMHYTSFN